MLQRVLISKSKEFKRFRSMVVSGFLEGIDKNTGDAFFALSVRIVGAPCAQKTSHLNIGGRDGTQTPVRGRANEYTRSSVTIAWLGSLSQPIDAGRDRDAMQLMIAGRIFSSRKVLCQERFESTCCAETGQSGLWPKNDGRRNKPWDYREVQRAAITTRVDRMWRRALPCGGC